MESTVIREGEYAVVDGVEHKAVIMTDSLFLLLPQTVPCPDGWERAGGGGWRKLLPRSSASRLFSVYSYGYFKGILVSVRDVRPMDEAVGIYCKMGPSDVPPDPVFEEDPDPGVPEWRAIVPWGMVTNVQEQITEIPVVPADQ